MTLPLFPDNIGLEDRLREVFKAWVNHRARARSRARDERPLREESATVYQEMWHAFAAYCAERNLDITSIESVDIQSFLSTRGASNAQTKDHPASSRGVLSPRYAWRMLNLIDRIIRFHAEHEGIPPNPAAHDLLLRPIYRYANASHSDPLPEYLADTQAKNLITYLTEFQNVHLSSDNPSWKEVRDRTAVATMLGAGMTPGDVRALTLDGVHVMGGRTPDVPWKLALPGNGNSPARETPIAEWAGQQLALWLSVRGEQRIGGDLAFPATRAGKSWSHTACHEACKAVLHCAGLGHDSGGLFKLRHTFALRQLGKGNSEEEVARWLGLVDLNGMSRYRRILIQHVDIE